MSEGDSEDLFYVLLPDNQVETLSLDELDDAFQADRIAETALVCRVGDTKWVTPAELASYMKADSARWQDAVKISGFKPNE